MLILVAVGAVLWVIARQLLPQRITRISLVVLPVALAYAAARGMPASISGPVMAELLASLAVSVACGLWQARVTEVYAGPDGTWWMRGGWSYLLAWAVFIAARLLLRLAVEGPAGAWGAGVGPALWMTGLDVAVAWGVRSAIIYLRHPQIGAAVIGGPAR
jgi:hypothetical protein